MLQRIQDFLGESEQREPCLVEPDILPFGGKMLLYGQAGVMKSMLVLQLCYEVACGLPWLGQFPTTAGRVVYLQCELPRGKFRDRVRIMQAAYTELPDDMLWVYSSKTLQIHSANAEYRSFVDEMRDIRPALWVIDPQYKVLLGDENSATDMQRLYNELDRLADEVGCATVLVSHARNTRFGADGERLDLGYQEVAGSHRQQDWGDAVCRLQRTRTGKILKFEKTRYEEAPDILELEFEAETLTHRASGNDDVEVKIRGALAGGGVEQGELVAMLVNFGFAEMTIRRRLERLQERGEVQKVPVANDRRKNMLRLKGA